MVYRQKSSVRITYIPTGLSAIARDHRSTQKAIHSCHVNALILLKAKLAKLREDPSWVEGCHSGRVRSYHLNPPLGIPPHVRNEPSGQMIPVDKLDAMFLDQIMLERRKLISL